METQFYTSDDSGLTRRIMNDVETQEHNAFLTSVAKEKEQQAKYSAARKAARQAVLDKLGLTADEAAALFD